MNSSSGYGGFHTTDAGKDMLGARPEPETVRLAQSAISRIESDLALRLAYLPSFINTEELPSKQSLAEQEAQLRHEAELAKQPHQAIITLSRQQHKKQKQDDIDRPAIAEADSDQYSCRAVADAARHCRTKLDLSGRGLQHFPSLSPSSLSSSPSLSGLVVLDLSRNQLKDLPESITNLQNLEVLDLQSNYLSRLPNSIELLSHLKILNVSGNMLKTLPEAIMKCRSMVELQASFNQLENLPSKIGHGLVSLECLSLHSNKLNHIPSSITHLRNLKMLDLHFNKILTLPHSIGNLKTLEKLNISNNFSDFGGTLPFSIRKLSHLVELDLSSNQLKVLPDSIGALTKLKVLNVENNPLVVPPLDVVEHSMKAVLEYMKARWHASQYSPEETHHVYHANKSLIRTQTSNVRRNGSRLANIFNHNCKAMDLTSISLPKRILDSSSPNA